MECAQIHRAGAGTFLSPGEAAGLFDLYNQGNLPYRAESDYRGIRVLPDAFSLHEKRIFEVIDVEAVRKKKFRVAVDCVNGVGAVFSAGFLRRLGCEVFAINDRPDGNFARSPEPLPENLGALCRAVRENGCDVGFGQDPDGDRLTVVTEKGSRFRPIIPLHWRSTRCSTAAIPGRSSQMSRPRAWSR